ncbi:MAG: ABC transporter ATP-binding protein [Clostridia bacterium]|nr:ABC transporter ATP-binding protein [Clostridia bacterium]
MIFDKNINKYYLRYSWALLIGIATLFCIDYVELIIPELYRMVINGLNDGYNVIGGVQVPFDMAFVLNKICLPILLIILTMVVGRFVWRLCFIGTSLKVEHGLRRSMFDRCKDLSQQYYQVNKVGDLMSYYTNDLETVQDCFAWSILMITDVVILGGMAFIKMMRMSWLLTLLSMIPMALMAVIGVIMGKYMEAKWEQRQAAFSKLSDFAQESYSGVAVIKAFVNEYRELLTFRKHNKDNEKVNVEFVKLSMKLDIFTELLIESVVCIILGYGGWLAHEGVFNAGQLIEYYGYFDSLIWPVIAVAELIKMTSQGKASMKRISALIDAKIDVADGPNVTEPMDLKLNGEIEFRHMTFAYPGTEIKVLDDVSFTVKAGENIGVIGRTGSGKSTIADLLLRTYNVEDGTLFLDGKDVNTIPIYAARANIAYVPQDNFLFSDTIENNIAFFEEPSDEESTLALVENSARLADVDDNVKSFSAGYSTLLGERGVTVSGGQKQRISIARALIRNAPVLVLDDSLSAVDVETEEHILTNLRDNRKGMTTLIIGHRISTMSYMDRIIFIDEGRIAGMGTHAELLKNNEKYKHMAELQKIEAEKERGERL